VGCIVGFVIGFVPPTGVKHWPTPIYVAAMVAGIVISSLPPFIIEKIKKPSRKLAHPDDVLVDVGPTDAAQARRPAAEGGRP